MQRGIISQRYKNLKAIHTDKGSKIYKIVIDYNNFPEKVDEKARQIDDDQSLDKTIERMMM